MTRSGIYRKEVAPLQRAVPAADNNGGDAVFIKSAVAPLVRNAVAEAPPSSGRPRWRCFAPVARITARLSYTPSLRAHGEIPGALQHGQNLDVGLSASSEHLLETFGELRAADGGDADNSPRVARRRSGCRSSRVRAEGHFFRCGGRKWRRSIPLAASGNDDVASYGDFPERFTCGRRAPPLRAVNCALPSFQFWTGR